MKMICLNCGKELSTEHDLRYDMKTQKMKCVYCMEGLIREHVGWRDGWREENIDCEKVEEQEQEYRKDMSDAMRIIVRHIFECAEELKQLGYSEDDLEV